MAINTIVGGVAALSANSALTATTSAPNTGAITVAATYGGSINATVAALAATLAISEGASTPSRSAQPSLSI